MSYLKFIKWLSFAMLACSLGSCAINSNFMFKTPKDGSFVYDSIPMRPVEEYRISVDDKIQFQLYPNAGKGLIESISGTTVSSSGSTASTSVSFEYTVNTNGKVEFPLLGDIEIAGLTVAECEDTLEYHFKQQYQDPYVKVRITNQRCIIFPGNGDAKIVQIVNNNTTLMEVIALSGGIPSRGRAKIIKLMRKTSGKREVYLIDIATIEGLKYADMIVQGNDYIYVEPNPQIANGIIAQIGPISSLITSVLLLYSIIYKF